MILALALAWAALQSTPTPLETTVGMPARIEELVLPGPELTVAAADADAPLVVRLVSTSPHGDARRYDFEVWALEAGDYDLRERLKRVDGVALDLGTLPPIPIHVGSVLANARAKPHTPKSSKTPVIGGYTSLILGAAVVWVIGLVWLLLSGRARRAGDSHESTRPRTLAERLRPLVERARDGQLSSSERSQLELSLVAYWRRKLGLASERPEDALIELRAHPEAGPLLTSLERWLHEPGPPAAVDVAALLEPYRNLPANLFDDVAGGGAQR